MNETENNHETLKVFDKTLINIRVYSDIDMTHCGLFAHLGKALEYNRMEAFDSIISELDATLT